MARSSATAEDAERLKRSVASDTRNDSAKQASCLGHEDRSGVIVLRRPEATYVSNSTQAMGELVDLAWPIAAAMLGETAMGLVDTKLVGGLGSAALGGVGVATTIMFLGYAVVFGLMRGVKIQTAHAIGQGRTSDGFVYAKTGLGFGFAIGAIVLLACRDVRSLLEAIGTEPEIVPFASDFLAAVTLGAPATCGVAALIQHRQAIGDSRTPMLVGIAGNLVNALLGVGLIYGRMGLPALGVRGAGYATASTEFVELLIMILLLARDERRPRSSSDLSCRRAARGIMELGLPTGIQYGAEMVGFTLFTAVLGGLGRAEIASHQIALNVIRVSFLPGVAISEAASVLVGRSLGARLLERADLVTKNALKLAVSFMAVCGLLFAAFGETIAEFFSNDQEVIAITRRLLLVAALFQVLDAINIVLRGALRGAQDVRVVAVVGVLVVWSCIPTAAYFLGKQLELGAFGAWFGFVGETTLSAVLFWRRWSRGGWRQQST